MSTDHPERRATDAQPEQFDDDALGRVVQTFPAFAEGQVETIDMDAALPPGHGDAEELAPALRAAAPVDKAQQQARMQLARFKGSLADFEMTPFTRVAIDDVKRGDVVEIRTIVGSIYLLIVDRIPGLVPDSGEILCECRYDLPGQWALTHAASVLLPVCAKSHVVQRADGSARLASRNLKMKTATELPERVRSLLRENFFVEIRLHANPRKERLRPIDLFRALQRALRKLKAGGRKS